MTTFCAMIDYGIANSDHDLHQILDLQARNLPFNISKSEASSQGFVTVQHDFELLKRMNSPHAHIVARSSNQVIGYALVMLPSFRNDIPVLVPMFNEIDQILYRDKKLGEAQYFVMGQICIDKNHRGQGVFIGLYDEMKKRMSAHFDYIITEVDELNSRSMRAHEKVGFQNVHRYQSSADWAILLLPIRNS